MDKRQQLIELLKDMPLHEADSLIEEFGFKMRIRYQDGVSAKNNSLSIKNRIDVAVKNNHIVQAYIGL